MGAVSRAFQERRTIKNLNKIKIKFRQSAVTDQNSIMWKNTCQAEWAMAQKAYGRVWAGSKPQELSKLSSKKIRSCACAFLKH